ncbi:MAG: hypothetical protein ACOC5B_01255, partial [Myxococcota bacterium]
MLGWLVGALLAAGCSKNGEAEANLEANARSEGMSGGEQLEGANRCDADAPDREVSEYDTSGDDTPDVRKVFRKTGGADDSQLVLVCREADVNADGVKDVVRHYDEDGSPLREEADRDFDGRMDTVTYYDSGDIVRQELDTDADGRMDTKVFYQDGKPLRAERDQAGRSTANDWKPDTWEYYERGRLVRIGFDLDGDGEVDRWDRNDELRKALRARENGDSEGGEGGMAAGIDEADPTGAPVPMLLPAATD